MFMADCRIAEWKWACHYTNWVQHTFHMTDDATMVFVIGSFVLGVLTVLFLIWLLRCAQLLWALNTFLDRSPRGKLSHGLRSYLSISILRKDLKELLQ
jgi:hypothetical protein